MMHKKTFPNCKVVALVLALIIGFSANLFTIEANAITPRWTSIYSIDLVMSFDGSEGNVTGTSSKQSTATRIEGTVFLYELAEDDWIYIGEWYNSRSRGTLAVSGDFTCESGVTYKAVFVVTAYTGSIPETETVEYIDTCP